MYKQAQNAKRVERQTVYARLNQFLLKKTENACNARSSFGLCNTSCTVTSHQSRDQISAMHWCG